MYISLNQIWHNNRFLCLALLELCNCAYYRKVEKQWWQSISTYRVLLNMKRFRQMLTYPDFIVFYFKIHFKLTSLQNSVWCILCSEWFQERTNFIAIDLYVCFSIHYSEDSRKQRSEEENKTKQSHLFGKDVTTYAKHRSLISRT